MIQLELVENCPQAVDVLYELLRERQDRPEINISHKRMPTYEEHCNFVSRYPYKAWYIVYDANEAVGSVYLTTPPRPGSPGNEIGVFILKKYHRHGYAFAAIEKLLEIHGEGRYLANINPDNAVSIKLFERLGFRLCQYTFELERKPE